MYPDELKYHEGHGWVRVEGEEAVIGITAYAEGELEEIIYVELPEEGFSVTKDEPYGSVESSKAVEDLIAPISGEVLRRNDEVIDAPDMINQDPYGEGWLIVVKPEDEGELEQLMTAEDYRTQLGEDEEEEVEEEEELAEEELEVEDEEE